MMALVPRVALLVLVLAPAALAEVDEDHRRSADASGEATPATREAPPSAPVTATSAEPPREAVSRAPGPSLAPARRGPSKARTRPTPDLSALEDAFAVQSDPGADSRYRMPAAANTPGPEPVAPSPPPAVDPAVGDAAVQPPVSPGWAALRAGAALAAVGALLALGLSCYRELMQRRRYGAIARGGRSRRGWLWRWMPTPVPEANRIEVLARSYFGTKESLCVVRVGPERFLIGVTAAQISLLGRLDAPSGSDTVRDPGMSDFAAALSSAHARGATSTGTTLPEVSGSRDDGLTEQAIRAALARSRQRLARVSAAGERHSATERRGSAGGRHS